MNKDKRDETAQKSNWAAYALAALLATLAGFFAVYVTFGSKGNRVAETALTPPSRSTALSPAINGPLAGLNRGDMARFLIHREPKDLAAFDFSDGQGTRVSLKNWQGKVVLLNLWATWCLPCLKEMPALDRLKGKLGADGFDVVAISLDRGSIDKPRKFLRKIDAKRLAVYHDASGQTSSKLKVLGMPTTLLIDREGREIGRLVGPAEWDSGDAVALLRAAAAGEQP